MQGDLISRALLNDVCKDPFSQKAHIYRYQGLEPQHTFLEAVVQCTTVTYKHGHIG